MSSKSLVTNIFYTLPLWIMAWATKLLIIADLASLLGTLVGVYQFWLIIGKRNRMTNFIQIGAISLLLIQNMSWILSTFIHYLNFKYALDKSLKFQMNLDVGDYSFAVIYVTLFVLMLVIFSKNSKYTLIEEHISQKLISFRYSTLTNTMQIASVLILIDIFILMSGAIGQRTINTTGFDKGEIPLWLPIFEQLLNFGIILNVIFYINLIKIKHLTPKIFVFWVILVILFLITSFLYFTKGRSPFIFSLISYLFWYYFFLGIRPKFLRSIPYVIIVYPSISFLLLFSNYIRNDQHAIILLQQNKSMITFLPKAFSTFFNNVGGQKEEKVRTTENISTRSLVANPLALCIKLPFEKKNFVLGENIINSFIWIIPRKIFPEKVKYLKQEDLLYANFPIGSKDAADSLYLYSYADFGWLGIFIYPYLIVKFWRLILLIINYLKPSPFFIAIVFTSFLPLFTISMGEGSIVVWFSILRTFCFIMFIGYIIKIATQGRRFTKPFNL